MNERQPLKSNGSELDHAKHFQMIQSEAYKMQISGLTTVRKKAEHQSQYCRHEWINFLQDANQNKKLKSGPIGFKD